MVTEDAQAHLPDLLELDPEDAVAVRFDALAQQTEGGAEALIAALGDSRAEAAGPVLEAIATTAPGKDVRKAARRALHRLRGSGLDVRVPVAVAAEPAATTATDVQRVVRALVSPIDGMGSRLLWLVLERPHGGLLVFNLVLNDLTGLKDAFVTEMTSRRFEADLKGWHERTEMSAIDIPSEYGLALLSEDLVLSGESQTPLPRDFVMRRGVLGELPPPPTDALIHQHISRGQVLLMPNLLDESAALLDEVELAGWLFGYDEVKSFVRELRQVAESRLIVTTEPREQRLQRVMTNAIDTLYTPALRRALRRRLEEMAYIFWTTNRERSARRAVAAAFAIGDTGSLHGHPLLRAMVERSIDMAIQLERAGQPPDPLAGQGM